MKDNLCDFILSLPMLLLVVACGLRNTEWTVTPAGSKLQSPAPAITPTSILIATPRPTDTSEPTPSSDSEATPTLTPQIGNAYYPCLSADGRFLSFVSFADYQSNIYVYDRLNELVLPSTGTLTRRGVCNQSVSDDGRYKVFNSQAEGEASENWDVFVRDRRTKTTELVSRSYDGNPPDGDSDSAVISADGRYIAFWSWASNLVPGDTQQCQREEFTYNCGDIFIYDRQTGTLERVDVGEGSGLGRSGYDLSLSADGRYLAYYSQIYDRKLQAFESICQELETGHCTAYSPKLSADGRYVAFHDGNQVYVYDRQSRTTEQVSVSSSGEPADRDSGFVWHYEGFFSSLYFSPDGRWVAFTSLATNLVPGWIKPDECMNSDLILYDGPHCYELYLHDLETGKTILVNR